MRILCLSVIVMLSGCLLDSEECGQAFELSDGQCRPVERPPPYRSASDMGERQTIEGSELSEDAQTETSVNDATAPADAMGLSPFTAFSDVLVVDRTEVSDSRPTPALPGTDIDAIIVVDDIDAVIGRSARIIDAQVNDPFEANVQTNTRAALDEPDGRAVSIGPQGFIRVALELDRPLRTTDVLTIFELEERPEDADRYEVFMCIDGSAGLEGCRSLGEGTSGPQIFPLIVP